MLAVSLLLRRSRLVSVSVWNCTTLLRMQSNRTSNADWQKVWTNAEKVVGFPPSYLSLRTLVSDEISNVASHMPRLIATDHPLLRTAKRLIYDSKNALQRRGLIVLLVAKAAGIPRSKRHQLAESELTDGIQQCQRSLAEITELIHTATLIHRGIVDLSPAAAAASDLAFGNKMAVLSGDFLLASASVGLSRLGNTKVVELMGAALGHIVQGQFDFDGHSVIRSLDQWRRATYLMSGSLLAHACSASLSLAGHPPHYQQAAHDVGLNLALAYQLQHDLAPFTANMSAAVQDGGVLLSAPVALYLEDHPEEGSDTGRLLEDVAINRDVLDRTQGLCVQYSGTAKERLAVFPAGRARETLASIADALSHV